MKKVLLVFLAGIIVSCSNTNDLQNSINKQKIEQTKNNEKKVKSIPDWFVEPPQSSVDVYYFVGSGESKSVQLSMDIAVMEAQEQLASVVDTLVSQRADKFVAQLGDSKELQTNFEEATKRVIAEVQAGGYQIKEKEFQAYNDYFTAYVLLEFTTAEVNQLFYQQLQKEALKDAKLSQTEAFKELEEELERQ
ncbi:MAG: hypothetical protein EB076_09170 [Flavobacteriia bacterium]|nr:hypothetical protein [Flavobacteriia bacterium]